MSSVINTNIFSVHAQRQASLTQRSEQVSMERLSSGTRINQAKDDAFGVAMTGYSNTQISGYSQSMRNANDGVSMAQIADGAMGGITDALQRMRELALQGASDSYSNADRESLQNEFTALQSEISGIIQNTTFNSIDILNRPESQSRKILEIQAGASTTNAVENHVHNSLEMDSTTKGYYTGGGLSQSAGVDQEYTLTAAGDRTIEIEVDGVLSDEIELDAGTKTTVAWAAELKQKINSDPQISAAGKSVSVSYDLSENEFVVLSESDGEGSTVKMNNGIFRLALGTTAAAEDGQSELVSLVGLDVSQRQMSWSVDGQPIQHITLPEAVKTPQQWAAYLEQAVDGVEVTTQWLTTSPPSEYKLTVASSTGDDGSVSLSGGVAPLGLMVPDTDKIKMNHYDLDDPEHALGLILMDTEKVNSQVDAEAMLSKIDAAIAHVNEGRAHFAAVENHLSTVTNYLDDARVKVSEARSNISDTDFAAESAELAKMDILKQVTTAMMAQANQLPKQMLQLFK